MTLEEVIEESLRSGKYFNIVGDPRGLLYVADGSGDICRLEDDSTIELNIHILAADYEIEEEEKKVEITASQFDEAVKYAFSRDSRGRDMMDLIKGRLGL